MSIRQSPRRSLSTKSRFPRRVSVRRADETSELPESFPKKVSQKKYTRHHKERGAYKYDESGEHNTKRARLRSGLHDSSFEDVLKKRSSHSPGRELSTGNTDIGEYPFPSYLNAQPFAPGHGLVRGVHYRDQTLNDRRGYLYEPGVGDVPSWQRRRDGPDIFLERAIARRERQLMESRRESSYTKRNLSAQPDVCLDDREMVYRSKSYSDAPRTERSSKLDNRIFIKASRGMSRQKCRYCGELCDRRTFCLVQPEGVDKIDSDLSYTMRSNRCRRVWYFCKHFIAHIKEKSFGPYTEFEKKNALFSEDDELLEKPESLCLLGAGDKFVLYNLFTKKQKIYADYFKKADRSGEKIFF